MGCCPYPLGDGTRGGSSRATGWHAAPALRLWLSHMTRSLLAGQPRMVGSLERVLTSIPRVYAVWYLVLPAPGSPRLLPRHPHLRADADATAQAWLAPQELVRGVGRLSHALT